MHTQHELSTERCSADGWGCRHCGCTCLRALPDKWTEETMKVWQDHLGWRQKDLHPDDVPNDQRLAMASAFKRDLYNASDDPWNDMRDEVAELRVIHWTMCHGLPDNEG
jgi:hypothetical protein